MKNIVTFVTLIAILVTGIIGVVYMFNNVPVTYDGSGTDVYEIMQDPAAAAEDTKGADGAASIIVKENLEKTHAVNDVTSIVFDFRGYDTMGEAFILVIAVTGTAVILRRNKKRGEGDE